MKATMLGLVVVMATSAVGLARPPGARAEQQATVPKRIRVGGNVESAKKLYQPAPEYPPLAKMARVQGTVKLDAILHKDGTIADLKVISGHPLLVQAAIAAVSKWRYQPTLLNGEPVEVETEIGVNFVLAGGPSDSAVPAGGAEAPSGDSSVRLSVDQDQLKAEHSALTAVDPTTATDVRRLLDASGMRQSVARVLPQVMALARPQVLRAFPTTVENRDKIADDIIAKFEDWAKSDEFENLLIPIMARHFTDDEIKSMLAFYESPAGRHYVQDSGLMTQEFQKAIAEHTAKVLTPQVIQQIIKEHPELQHSSGQPPSQAVRD